MDAMEGRPDVCCERLREEHRRTPVWEDRELRAWPAGSRRLRRSCILSFFIEHVLVASLFPWAVCGCWHVFGSRCFIDYVRFSVFSYVAT